MTSQERPGTCHVLYFLSSLTPDLSRLAPRITASGVHTAADLAGLAVLPVNALDGFLRNDLRLNPFEATIVRAGLVRMYTSQL